MDQEIIKSTLDKCLVSNYLDSPDVFEELEDPFPQWFKKLANLHLRQEDVTATPRYINQLPFIS